jgi:hypothetical protein
MEPTIILEFTPQETQQLAGLVHMAAQAGGSNVARFVVVMLDKIDAAVKKHQETGFATQANGSVQPQVPLRN